MTLHLKVAVQSLSTMYYKPCLKMFCCQRGPSHISKVRFQACPEGGGPVDEQRATKELKNYKSLLKGSKDTIYFSLNDNNYNTKLSLDHHPVEVKGSSCKTTNSATKSILKIASSVSCDNICVQDRRLGGGLQ